MCETALPFRPSPLCLTRPVNHSNSSKCRRKHLHVRASPRSSTCTVRRWPPLCVCAAATIRWAALPGRAGRGARLGLRRSRLLRGWLVGSPGDDRPREAETARQRGIEAIVGPRLLVLVFSHPCRGLPGRGCHCVAPRESVVVALGRSTVGIVAHGVPEGLDLDGDDALADKQDALNLVQHQQLVLE